MPDPTKTAPQPSREAAMRRPASFAPKLGLTADHLRLLNAVTERRACTPG